MGASVRAVLVALAICAYLVGNLAVAYYGFRLDGPGPIAKVAPPMEPLPPATPLPEAPLPPPPLPRTAADVQRTAPEPAAPPSEVTIEEVSVFDGVDRGGVVGVEVRFETREGVEALRDVSFVVRASSGGRPLRAASAAGGGSLWLFDDRGALSAFALPDFLSAGSRVAFFPYFAMGLEPGARQVRFEVVARARDIEGRGARPIPARGAAAAVATVEVPPYRSVSITVDRAEVEPDVYDPALFRPHKGRPDLTWSLEVGAPTPGSASPFTVFTSRTHDDRFGTTWRTTSPPVRLHRGDTLTLRIYDRDVVSHDDIGALPLDLEALERLRSEPEVLAFDRVRALSLGRIVIR